MYVLKKDTVITKLIIYHLHLMYNYLGIYDLTITLYFKVLVSLHSEPDQRTHLIFRAKINLLIILRYKQSTQIYTKGVYRSKHSNSSF